MEILIEFIFEVVIELVFELIAVLVGDVILSKSDKASEKIRIRTTWSVYAFFGCIGVLIGVGSVHVFPLMTSSLFLQILNIIITPFLVGAAMHYIGKLKEKKKKKIVWLDRFVSGYVFALSLALGRFLYATMTS